MVDRRGGPDRRKKPTNPLTLSSFFGMRREIRREEDRRVHRYVDIYSGRLVTIVLLSVALSLVDTFFTLEIVGRGGVELNPVMDFFLRRGPMLFLGVKYFLTVAGLLILVVHQNFRPFGCVNCIRYILLFQFLSWVSLVLWECYLVVGPGFEAMLLH